jgi:hypothetical protein
LYVQFAVAAETNAYIALIRLHVVPFDATRRGYKIALNLILDRASALERHDGKRKHRGSPLVAKEENSVDQL